MQSKVKHKGMFFAFQTSFKHSSDGWHKSTGEKLPFIYFKFNNKYTGFSIIFGNYYFGVAGEIEFQSYDE